MHTPVEKLLHTYGTSVLRYAYSFMKNESDAQDIVQETFLQYIEKAPDLKNEAHEKAWLLTVAGNLCRNRLNYRTRHPSDELKDELISENREDLSFVWEAVEKLPDHYRAVIHLYYEEDYSTSEIAQILDTKDATVRSWLARARKKLKTVLREDYDFDE